jgi:D-tyrosyl-tRNA(Tyr) deacylase
MRLLIQRVSRASVTVEGRVTGAIGQGLLCFLGVREGDTDREAEWLVSKASQLRVFPDSEGKMNLSVEDIGGQILLVSQFTLYGDAKKGNRPNFMLAAKPEEANRLYERMLQLFRERLGADRLAAGVFQAMMNVELVNQGPVTILLEKENEATEKQD